MDVAAAVADAAGVQHDLVDFVKALVLVPIFGDADHGEVVPRHYYIVNAVRPSIGDIDECVRASDPGAD